MDSGAAQALLEDFLLRVAVSLFVGLRQDGTSAIGVWAYSSIGATAIKGLGVLIVPMLIAAFIVLNTMLGTVYERLKDIGIYAAVGLAPSHISLLFIAEACAYAVLGITLGYLGGQGMGLVLNYWDMLGGLNLNYSSLAAVFSALIVMGVVLLSTVYPARVAARTAVPDLVRRWQPDPPVGAEWEFRFPFLVSVGRGQGSVRLFVGLPSVVRRGFDWLVLHRGHLAPVLCHAPRNGLCHRSQGVAGAAGFGREPARSAVHPPRGPSQYSRPSVLSALPQRRQ